MNTRKGFTLPELLIVLLVLGILVGIAFMVRGPVLSSARETAWNSSMTTLTHALNDAAMANNDKYAPSVANASFTGWASALVVAPSQHLSDYLDKVPVNPWMKTPELAVLDHADSFAAANDLVTGTAPAIQYAVTDALDHFAIRWSVNSTFGWIGDSMATTNPGTDATVNTIYTK